MVLQSRAVDQITLSPALVKGGKVQALMAGATILIYPRIDRILTEMLKGIEIFRLVQGSRVDARAFVDSFPWSRGRGERKMLRTVGVDRVHRA